MQMDAETTIAQIKAEQQTIREAYEEHHAQIVSYEEANAKAPRLSMPPETITFKQMHERLPDSKVAPADVQPYMDWRMFLLFWGFKGETLQQLLVNPEAERTLKEGKAYLERAIKQDAIRLEVLVDFDYALRHGNDIILTGNGTVLPMLRRQTTGYQCLSDYYDESEKQLLVWFTIVCEPRQQAANEEQKLMLHAICARLAEACAEWLQRQLYNDTHVLRVAFGYATCPDHSLKRIVFDLLDAERRLGITLTDHYSIQPSTAICGLFVCHPEARYFPVGRIDQTQLADYCQRRGISIAKGEELLSKYLTKENI